MHLAFYFSHCPQYFRLFACLISAIVLSDILADTWCQCGDVLDRVTFTCTNHLIIEHRVSDLQKTNWLYLGRWRITCLWGWFGEQDLFDWDFRDLRKEKCPLRSVKDNLSDALFSITGSEINFFIQVPSGDWKFFFSRQMKKSGRQKAVCKIFVS